MPSQSPESLIAELLSKCEQAVETGNFEEAITGCRAILQVTPDHIRAKQLLDEAQSKMEADLFVRDNLRRAQEYFNARDFQKCMSECQKIQLLDNNNASALNLMKKAQEKMEAEPFVQNFITSGQSLYDSGLYNEAISQWEKVRAIDPVYPGLDGLIQGAREKLGDNESLIDTIASNSMPSIDLNLDINTEQGPDGFSFDAFGIQEEEPKTEKLEFQSDEDRIKYLLHEGDELSAGGHYQRAIEVWSEIFMLDVNHPEALQKIEVARQAAAQQRQSSQEVVKRAIAAYEGGEIEQARELFEEVRSTDPDNSEAARYLDMLPSSGAAPASLNDLIAQAKEAEDQGQYRDAALLYSQALAIDADNADLADRVKNLNLMAKRQEQGRTVLGNARAFLAEGKLESARHAVTKILEADPSNPEALEIMKEIKAQAGAGGGIAESKMVGAAPVSRAGKKSLPLMQLMFVGGALVILGSGFLLWNSFGGKSSKDTAQAKPIKRLIKRPSNVNSQNPALTKPPRIVNPQDKQKASDMIQEAQFYFMEKRYDEALQKADDALKIDPTNKEAVGIKEESSRLIKEAIAAEQKILDDANAYFGYSEFAGAVRLYEKYLTRHPESVQHIQPQIIKCYYNLGVIAIRQWRCDTAADYFRQVLFIDETDKLSKDALALSRKCQKMGTSDMDVRKAVAFMEMRK